MIEGKLKYHGYLLKGSLEDTTVLEKLTITKTETYSCPENKKADYTDDFWTGISFEGNLVGADKIAKILKFQHL